MIRSYRYRIQPNKRQAKILERIIEMHRWLYNDALDERRYLWRARKVSVNYYHQANQIKDIRTDDPDLLLLNFSSIQQTLRRLDKAYSAFFRRIRRGETAGYPRFKSRHRWRSVEYRFGDGVGWAKNGRLRIQNAGNIRIFLHRPIPAEAEIKAVIITHHRDGKRWFVCFQLELPDPAPVEHPGQPVGIDLGVTTVAALSTGERVKAPRFYRESQRDLRVKQRRQSRRKNGSAGRREATRQVAKTHERIANQRRDFNHKLSRRLVGEFSLIGVEDLTIIGLSRSMLAESVHDSAWGQLLAFLSYKAEEANAKVVSVDPRYTSQVCSRCGSIVKKTLSVRVHRCPDCGLELDRDVNAAINVLNRMHVLLEHDSARTERQGVNVIGCDVRSPGSSLL